MSEIQFIWNPAKAIAAAAYIVGRLGKVDKIKLVKMLYIADRDHFLKHGYPITGDVQYALPKGPAPSKTYDMLKGNRLESEDCLRCLHEEDFVFSLREGAMPETLDETEITVLNDVIEEHGQKNQWTLVEETHSYSEYVAVYREGTSTIIPYEKILECYEQGDGSRFRRGRPVISEATISRMACPFPAWE